MQLLPFPDICRLAMVVWLCILSFWSVIKNIFVYLKNVSVIVQSQPYSTRTTDLIRGECMIIWIVTLKPFTIHALVYYFIVL